MSIKAVIHTVAWYMFRPTMWSSSGRYNTKDEINEVPEPIHTHKISNKILYAMYTYNTCQKMENSPKRTNNIFYIYVLI